MFKYEFMGGGNGILCRIVPIILLGISQRKRVTLSIPKGPKNILLNWLPLMLLLTENYIPTIKSLYQGLLSGQEKI